MLSSARLTLADGAIVFSDAALKCPPISILSTNIPLPEDSRLCDRRRFRSGTNSALFRAEARVLSMATFALGVVENGRQARPPVVKSFRRGPSLRPADRPAEVFTAGDRRTAIRSRPQNPHNPILQADSR